MPPPRPPPPELDALRRAVLARADAWQEYHRLTLLRRQALRDGEVAQIRALGRKSTSSYEEATRADEELSQARWRAMDAGHTLADLDTMAARWTGARTELLEEP